MTWFTHFTRPARKGLAPGGRNHVRRPDGRTLCGIRLPRWMRLRIVVLDPLTGAEAYPTCRRCSHLAQQCGVGAGPAPGAVLGRAA